MLNNVSSNKFNSCGTGRKNINSSNPNVTKNARTNAPSFNGGVLDVAMLPLQFFESQPMMNVGVKDCVTAIGPRTYQESKTNGFAGFEAFRRESSGLIVNCMIPGVVVAGVAKLLNKKVFGYKSGMASNWADEKTLNTIADYWKDSKVSNDVKVATTLRNIISKTSGNDDKSGVLKTFDKIIDYDKEITISDGKTKSVNTAISDLAKKIADKDKNVSNKDCDDLYKCIVEQTHISEGIKVGEKDMTVNLKSLLQGSTGLLKEFTNNGAYEKEAVDNIVKKSVKLVNIKSMAGLFGVVIPLALAMQPINRFITEKVSGKKGAPIYKDFTANDKKKEMTSAEKGKLWVHKILSAAAMCGVALISTKGKLPNKEMLQFRGIFPSMDQARIVSTATFASRILSSQDENDRREATIRDIGTFSALYFLGDYISKGTASLIEKFKPEVSLTKSEKALDKNAGFFGKLKHWAVDTTLKSSEEVVGKTAKTMRSVCQLSDILFSFALLGTIIPKVTRHLTDMHHAEDMKKAGMTDEEIAKYYKNKPQDSATFTGMSSESSSMSGTTAGGSTSMTKS
ncbi:hypothetical protein KBA27_03020 [bacterium]|nr:hypothetical protein [bacterium]